MTDATATDDAIEEAEDGEEQPKSGKKKFILIGAVVLVLLLVGGGAAAYFMGVFGGSSDGAGAAEEAAPSTAYFYELPEITVNLASTGGRAQYLKVRVSLELADREIVKAITPVQPRIMDAFQIHLRELRAQDLEGSMGVYRLKEELLRRVNLAVYPQKVDRILFNEMLVQ
ncbi:MAG: flagellar basal body-associated FliL family protein [Pseudomonadota bacterium]